MALERRLAARVDDGVAAVLDAVRKAERRLREESPRLAEHAARRLWTAAGAGDGLSCARRRDEAESRVRVCRRTRRARSRSWRAALRAVGACAPWPSASRRWRPPRRSCRRRCARRASCRARTPRRCASTGRARRRAVAPGGGRGAPGERRGGERARERARARDDDARRDAETAVRRERMRLSGDASERDRAFELSTDDADRDDVVSEGAFFPGFFPGNDRARAHAGAFESRRSRGAWRRPRAGSSAWGTSSPSSSDGWTAGTRTSRRCGRRLRRRCRLP